MILNYIFDAIVNIINGVLSFLPVVSLSSVFGLDLASPLSGVVSTWNAFMITFPYAMVAWHMLLWVVLPFEALMLLGKFLLGHRLPVNTN
jgi:hypothetical protein